MADLATSLAGVASSAASAAAVSLLPAQSGDVVYVQTFRDFFAYRAESVATVDGITVLAALGVGRWERLNVANPSWAKQTEWTINETTGSDEAAGGSADPLKTLRELQRRLGQNVLTQNVAVYIASEITEPYAATVTFYTMGRCGVYVGGIEAVVATGDVASWTPLNRTTEGNLLTVSGFNWAPHVDRKLRFTSGPLAGYSCWISDDLGAGVARLGPAIQDTVPFTPVSLPVVAATVPAAGNTFEIVTMPIVTPFTSFRLDGAFSGGINFYLQANNIQIGTNGVGALGTAANGGFRVHAANSRMFLSGCDLRSAAIEGAGIIANCRLSGGFTFTTNAYSNVQVMGGLSKGVMQVATAVRIDGDILMRGQLSIGRTSSSMGAWAAGVRIGNACFVGVAGDAIVVGSNAYLQVRPGSYTTGILYGTGNTGAGIRVIAGGKVTYQTKPVLNAGLGVGRETIIGGTDKLLSAVPYVETTNLAMIVAEV